MDKCKNCEMTDEYCASGDCPTSQSPCNYLATKPQAIDLTEKWRKGELPSGWYYYGIHNETDVIGCDKLKMYRNRRDIKDDIEVLAPVPSYEEYEQLENWNRFTANYHALIEAKEIAEYEKAELKYTVEALKSELKEVCDVLIRKCPEMKEWVMLNWKNLYEVQDE